MRELLTFALGAERYGIDILKVREIRCYEGATAIPGTPAFVKGVIDLRGAIVPVFDMRAKLRLEAAQPGGAPILIVLDLGSRAAGVIVDAVSDVVAIDANNVKAVPDLAGERGSKHIAGLANLEGGMLILLDIDGFTAGTELEPAQEAEAA